MKGIIFNVFEDFLDEKYGENTFDNIIEAMVPDVKEPFIAPGTYPDELLFSIIHKTMEEKNLELNPTLLEFGEFLFLQLAKKYPVFVKSHNNAKDFIKTIHDIIHVEVRKLFPEAVTPDFSYSNEKENEITITYTSKRSLFILAEGLINRCAKYYKEEIKLTILNQNMKDNSCIFHLKFVRN